MFPASSHHYSNSSLILDIYPWGEQGYFCFLSDLAPILKENCIKYFLIFDQTFFFFFLFCVRHQPLGLEYKEWGVLCILEVPQSEELWKQIRKWWNCLISSNSLLNCVKQWASYIFPPFLLVWSLNGTLTLKIILRSFKKKLKELWDPLILLFVIWTKRRNMIEKKPAGLVFMWKENTAFSSMEGGSSGLPLR